MARWKGLEARILKIDGEVAHIQTGDVERSVPASEVELSGPALAPVVVVRAPPPEARQFVCPECARVFTRAQALGLHRLRVHKVKGRKKQARAVALPSREEDAAYWRGRAEGLLEMAVIMVKRLLPPREGQAGVSSGGGKDDAD